MKIIRNFISNGLFFVISQVLQFLLERCQGFCCQLNQSENKLNITVWSGGAAGGQDCQTVPKEVCEQVAVPNCRQIAEEQVS